MCIVTPYRSCYCGSTFCSICNPYNHYWNGYYNHYTKVGSCPTCGAPIYEQHSSSVYSFGPPKVHHSCDCRLKLQPVVPVQVQIKPPGKPSLAKKKSNARW